MDGTQTRWAALVIAAALLAACGGSGEGLDGNGRPLGEDGTPTTGDPPPGSGPFAPSIEAIQDHVFTPHCVSCHAGATAPQGLRLEDAQTSYSMLVGVRSMEYPLLFRVAASDADNSYIIHKLEGTQEVGNQMPNGGPYLDQDTINVVRQWISDGAHPPGSAALDLGVLQ